jgi:hypothetical protein
LLHLHGNRLFAEKFLTADPGIKEEFVVAGNHGLGQPLRLHAATGHPQDEQREQHGPYLEERDR